MVFDNPPADLTADQVTVSMQRHFRHLRRAMFVLTGIMLIVALYLVPRTWTGFQSRHSSQSPTHTLQSTLLSIQRSGSYDQRQVDFGAFERTVRNVRRETTHEVIVEGCAAILAILDQIEIHRERLSAVPFTIDLQITSKPGSSSTIDWLAGDALASLDRLIEAFGTIGPRADLPDDRQAIGRIDEVLNAIRERLTSGDNGLFRIQVN